MAATPTGLPDCPFCDWQGDPELRKPSPSAPGIARALGTSEVALTATWEAQRMARLEAELLDHYRTHPLEQWVSAVLTYRRAAAMADA